MIRIPFFLFFTLLTYSSYVQAQSTRTYLLDEDEIVPRERFVDISHILMDLRFDAPEGIVRGTVTHTFTPLRQHVDSLFFDGPGIKIFEARLDGHPVPVKVHKEGVSVHPDTPLTWDKEHKISFTYEARPSKGLYFIGWNDPEGKSRKQIWSQGQAYDTRHWIPIYDQQNDKAITEMIVHFDGNYKVLSNGERVAERKNRDGTRTWHYRMTKPHSSYLIMVGIGTYNIEKRRSAGKVPMELWYYPETPERVEWMYKYSVEMMDWMENEIGVRYPWTTYAQIPVQDYTFGAMENTTATLFGDFYNIDEGGYLDRSYVNTNAHELAHQWFGDMVTERTLTHHWLQESFATHYGNLYNGVARGMDYYNWSRKLGADASLAASKKDNYPVASSIGGSTRHYPKGALVLDMLRHTVGNETYRRAIKYYLEKHAYGNVDSEDFLIAFHERTGHSLDWFWEQWIYRGGEPRFEVAFREVTAGGSKASEFTVTQTHPTDALIGLFKMPVQFEVNYQDGTRDTLLTWIEKYQHVVQIPNPGNKAVSYVLFDPNMRILKSVRFPKSFEMLQAQALQATHMLDRWQALHDMRSIPLEQKKQVLMQAFNKETFHATKTEILQQMREDDSQDYITIFRKGLNDGDVDVRKGALTHLHRVPKELLPDLERRLSDKSYGVVEQTLGLLNRHNPERIPQYLEQTRNLVGVRGHNVRVKWLEIAAMHGNEQALKDLVNLAGPSYEFITRGNAMAALRRLNHFDVQAMHHAIDAALNANYKLSADGLETLSYFHRQHRHRPIIENYYRDTSWESRQREILDKALGE
jgi:aminopeptidase N